MNNREKAVQVIRRQTLISDLATAKDVARRLDQAGLLAPDLPKPSRTSIKGYHTDHPWAEWDVDAAAIMALSNGRVVFQDADDWGSRIYMNPEEARAAAHKLLAAANYAEGKQ